MAFFICSSADLLGAGVTVIACSAIWALAWCHNTASTNDANVEMTRLAAGETTRVELLTKRSSSDRLSIEAPVNSLPARASVPDPAKARRSPRGKPPRAHGG